MPPGRGIPGARLVNEAAPLAAGDGDAGTASRLVGGLNPPGVPGGPSVVDAAVRVGGKGDAVPEAVRFSRSSSIDRSLAGRLPTAFQVASGPTRVYTAPMACSAAVRVVASGLPMLEAILGSACEIG
jgi:hypothetical protein